MSTLKSTIESLAAQFATSILGALRSASIDEVMSLTGQRASAAASGSSASGAAAPAKRGPGRPKKAAAPAAQPAPAASAPKKRGRPAGSGNAKAAAASKKTASGRLARRSAEDIGSVVDSIVSLLEQHSEGLRAEQIRGALGLDAKELPRPLADGLAAGTITKTGQKRATTYFAGGGKGKKRR